MEQSLDLESLPKLSTFSKSLRNTIYNEYLKKNNFLELNILQREEELIVVVVVNLLNLVNYV